MRAELSTAPLGPDEQLFDAAYLVSRGVRPLALVGTVPATPEAMSHAEQDLFRCGSLHGNKSPLPFVLKGNDLAQCGYVSHSWVLDLFFWLERGDVPLRQRERILGLLLGYSAAAIAEFDDSQAARALRNWSVGRRGNP